MREHINLPECSRKLIEECENEDVFGFCSFGSILNRFFFSQQKTPLIMITLLIFEFSFPSPVLIVLPLFEEFCGKYKGLSPRLHSFTSHFFYQRVIK